MQYGAAAVFAGGLLTTRCRSSGIGTQPEGAAEEASQLPGKTVAKLLVLPQGMPWCLRYECHLKPHTVLNLCAVVSPIAESPEAQSDASPSPASPAATAVVVAATPPPAREPLAAGVADGAEAFHSPVPLPDLRAPDEDLYASPESQPASSPAAAQDTQQHPAAGSLPPVPCTTAAAAAATAVSAVAVSPSAADVEQAAVQLAAVSLVAEPEEAVELAAAEGEPALQQLLRLCGQPSDVLALPSMTDLLEGALQQRCVLVIQLAACAGATPACLAFLEQ